MDWVSFLTAPSEEKGGAECTFGGLELECTTHEGRLYGMGGSHRGERKAE